MICIQPTYQRLQSLIRKIEYLCLTPEAKQFLNNYYESQAIRRSAASDYEILSYFAKRMGIK